MPSIRRMKRDYLDYSSRPVFQDNKLNSAKSLSAYDTSLIGALEKDHEEILIAYHQVMGSANYKDYGAINYFLGEFASLCTKHFQKEDKKLYGYLKSLASNKSQVDQSVVNDFSTEMIITSTSIFSSISQSPNIPVNKNNIDSFIKEFSEMGLKLKDRIEREESILYPIYENCRKVVDIS